MKARRDNSENKRHFIDLYRKMSSAVLILQSDAKLVIRLFRKAFVHSAMEGNLSGSLLNQQTVPNMNKQMWRGGPQGLKTLAEEYVGCDLARIKSGRRKPMKCVKPEMWASYILVAFIFLVCICERGCVSQQPLTWLWFLEENGLTPQPGISYGLTEKCYVQRN